MTKKKRTMINELSTLIEHEVVLKGWIKEIRNISKIKFILIRDRTGEMQCIALAAKTDAAVLETINKLTKESVIEIDGKVVHNKESRFGGIEVQIKDVKIISLSEATLPIDNTDKSTTEIEKRLDYRYLDTRNKKVDAIFKVRSKIAKALVNFFDSHGFTNINTPKITSIGVESGAALFEVKYFDRKAYLSQSPQIYKQMFVAGGFERVYELGVVFRAENSNTTRHLTEFTGIDFEMGFIDDYTDVMDMIEKMLISTLACVKEECKDEISLLGTEIHLPKHIPRISMDEAKEMLAQKGKRYSPDEDLDPEGEKMLGEYVKEKYDSEFVFLTLFPWAVRPFYHMRPEDAPHLTKSFDLLYNGVEIATGAQREHRYDVLKAQTEEKGLNFEEMEVYANIFKYGIPPHGGVGFGLDRMTQRLLNLNNVREAVLLPRDTKRLAP